MDRVIKPIRAVSCRVKACQPAKLVHKKLLEGTAPQSASITLLATRFIQSTALWTCFLSGSSTGFFYYVVTRTFEDEDP